MNLALSEYIFILKFYRVIFEKFKKLKREPSKIERINLSIKLKSKLQSTKLHLKHCFDSYVKHA